MPAPELSDLPDAPLRSETPATFTAKAEAWVAALTDTFTPEMQAFIIYLNSLGLDPSDFPTDAIDLQMSTARILGRTTAGTGATEELTVGLGLDLASGSLAIKGGLNAQTGTSYTLVLADAFKLVSMNNASANTLTIPPNASVAFNLGTRIDVGQYGAGQTTITPGAGVTIRASGGKLKTTAQYSGATIQKIGTNEWWAFGDLAV